MLPRESLLRSVEHRETLARVLDLADRALRTWTVTQSNFLSPAEVGEIVPHLKQLTELEVVPWGGYPQAERQRLALARPSLLISEDESDPHGIAKEYVGLAALDVRGNFLFDTATHRDFLGAILGTGIVRDKIGDILVLGEQGAQVLAVPELVEHLQMSLTQVRSVPVKVRQIGLDELKVRPPRQKVITTVEASLRLDAIASAGFSTSRSRMAELIQSGDVKVNWRTISQSSRSVHLQDLISIPGRGRVEVKDINQTKKGRYRVELTRFL
ncbi:MAG: photosystem II S4 domain protein [Cyanobacteria bacterium J06642_2]